MQIPLIFQIRKNCIISYNDYSVLDKQNPSEKPPIKSSGIFSLSAQKRMKKIIDIWQYTFENYLIEISFITLTISSKMKDEINYEKMLKKWIEIMQYRYGKFNYVWKVEFQKNGNIHYHLMIDEKIDWKVVRKNWNKIQKVHVDEYQIAMKNKYSRGFYYDEKMIDKNNNIISEEIQKERYEKGYKANWRNPNSTDVKIVDLTKENVGAYVSKYVAKNEDDKNETNKKITRFFGCNDELRLIKYSTLNEMDIDYYLTDLIKFNEIKEIKNENHQVVCSVHNKFNNDTIYELEKKQIEINRNILYKNKNIKTKLINKDITSYSKLFE